MLKGGENKAYGAKKEFKENEATRQGSFFYAILERKIRHVCTRSNDLVTLWPKKK